MYQAIGFVLDCWPIYRDIVRPNRLDTTRED